jgi:hypothetical protein
MAIAPIFGGGLLSKQDLLKHYAVTIEPPEPATAKRVAAIGAK